MSEDKRSQKDSKESSLSSREEDIFDVYEQEPNADNETGTLKKINLDQLSRKRRIRNKGAKKSSSQPTPHKNKDELIKAAQELLTLAGVSIESLQPSSEKASRIKKKGFAANVSKQHTSSDISVISNEHKVGSNEFKSTNSVESHKTPETIPLSKQQERKNQILDDPFDLPDASLSSTSFSQNELIPIRTTQSERRRAGFFHYFGITALILCILGSLIYTCLFISSLFADEQTNPIGEAFVPLVVEESESSDVSESEELYTRKILDPSSPETTDAREVINNFMNAESRRFAYAFIIQDEKSVEVFNEYWEQIENYDDSKLYYRNGFILPNKSVIATFTYQATSSSPKLTLRAIRAEGASFRIDWKSFRQVEENTIADFVKSPSTNPTIVRAWIGPNHYYNSKYKETFWQNYKAYGRDESIDCYISLNTSSAKNLYNAVTQNPIRHPIGGNRGAQVIMLVRKPEMNSKHCEIIEVFETDWDPTKD